MDLLPNLSLSLIAYPSICSLRLSHVNAQSRKISSTVPLPNGSNSRPRIFLSNASEETFLPPDGFLTELDPQVKLLTKFWC
jgi:hypothetical protein